jgi:hypothetical protein
MRIYGLNAHRAPYFERTVVYNTTEGCKMCFEHKYIILLKKCLIPMILDYPVSEKALF